MEELNTMNTFNNGFKIIRDGVVITLTPEEMSDFRYLEKAVTGRKCLECYNCQNEEEEEIVAELMEDEEVCYHIEDDFLSIIYEDAGMREEIIIDDYIEKAKKEGLYES